MNAQRFADIPHIFLGHLDPHLLNELREEIRQQVDGYSPVELNLDSAGPAAEAFQMAWSARGLIDYDADSRKIMTYQRMLQLRNQRGENQDPKGESLQTDLYGVMPTAAKVIELFTRRPIKCRLMSLRGHSAIPWHTHYGGGFSRANYQHVVIQLPLVESERCVYEVRNKITGEIASQIYRPGEAWIFNSFHEHRVVNEANVPRISLFIETNLQDIVYQTDALK